MNCELNRSVQFSIEEQLLRRNVKRFRGGLVLEAHLLLYHSTLGSRVIKYPASEGYLADAPERGFFSREGLGDGPEDDVAFDRGTVHTLLVSGVGVRG